MGNSRAHVNSRKMAECVCVCVWVWMKHEWQYRTSFDWYINCDWEPLKFDVNVNRRVTTHKRTNRPILNWLRCPFQWWSMRLCVFTADWHNNLLFTWNGFSLFFVAVAVFGSHLVVHLLSWEHSWIDIAEWPNVKITIRKLKWNGRRRGGGKSDDNGNGNSTHI